MHVQKRKGGSIQCPCHRQRHAAPGGSIHLKTNHHLRTAEQIQKEPSPRGAGTSLCSHCPRATHPPLDSWSLARINLAHRKDSKMFVGLVGKDGRPNACIYLLSLLKPTNETLTGLKKKKKATKATRTGERTIAIKLGAGE